MHKCIDLVVEVYEENSVTSFFGDRVGLFLAFSCWRPLSNRRKVEAQTEIGGCKSVRKRRSKFSTFVEVINEPLGLQMKMKHLLEFIIGQPLTVYKTWESCKTCTLSFESIMKWHFHYIQASGKQVCNKSMHSLNFEKERYHKSFSQNP